MRALGLREYHEAMRGLIAAAWEIAAQANRDVIVCTVLREQTVREALEGAGYARDEIDGHLRTLRAGGHLLIAFAPCATWCLSVLIRSTMPAESEAH